MVDTTVSTMLDSVKSVFDSTHTVLSSLKDGERIQLKELAEKVSSEVSMEPKYVLSLVSHFVHHTSMVHVTRGKHGGVVRGSKVVKPTKSSTTEVEESTSAAAE